MSSIRWQMCSLLRWRIKANSNAKASNDARKTQRRAIDLRTFNPLADPVHWDRQVARFPNSTIFHESCWLSVLNAAYGFEPIVLATYKNHEMRAAIPFMDIRSPLTGKRGVSLPFTDVCAPLASEKGVSASLLRDAGELARAKRWAYYETRGTSGQTNEAPSSICYYRHTLDLNRSVERIFEGFSASTKRAIRKSEAHALSVAQSHSLDSLRAYYRLHCITRKRHGLPPQPWRFFDEIHKRILSKDRGSLFLALDSQKAPIAGAVFLYSGSTAIYKFGASDKRFQEWRPNNFLFWEAINRFVNSELETLDFGRTSLDQAGLRRFKQGWGTSEKIVPYYRYRTSDNRIEEVADPTENWSNCLFRNSPIPISRLAGQLLYKHVG